MTDAEYAQQKARVEALIEKWAAPLGILWWDVDYHWHRLKDEDSPGCAASATTQWQYIQARVNWYLPTIADLSDKDLERAVVHEHLHILVDEMAPEGSMTPGEERVCSALAKAFVWTYEAGQAHQEIKMPGKKHLPGATMKENRQYAHIKASALKSGKPLAEAKTIAAKTVNKAKKG